MRLRYARSPRPVIRLVGAGRPNALHALDATRGVLVTVIRSGRPQGCQTRLDAQPLRAVTVTRSQSQPITRQACGSLSRSHLSVAHASLAYSPSPPVCRFPAVVGSGR